MDGFRLNSGLAGIDLSWCTGTGWVYKVRVNVCVGLDWFVLMLDRLFQVKSDML